MSAEAGSSKAGHILDSPFHTYNSDIQNAALKATKLAVSLSGDITFNRTVDNEFAQAIDLCSTRALTLTNSLLELAGTNHASSSRIKGKSKLEDQEDVVDRFGSLVVDALDQLFERADIGLDECLGRTRPAAAPVKAPLATSPATSSARHGRLASSILHAAHLPKPQRKFKRKVDNSNEFSWSPNLKHKYNAQMPLSYILHDAADASEDLSFSGTTLQSSHPYRYEIKHISYPRHMFEQRDPIPPSSFEHTPFTWIDTREGLDSLLDKLRHVQEIAVDLEHHSYRSFSGFLCLMQISTREDDFILDALTLREELEDLNEIFTDPQIVKVFHGADSDVMWLQQDFNVYIVNLFDTYHASKLLEFPKHGLGALLGMYCDFVPDKRYQLADWRIRPLPDEMMKYARSDTHFLLYVYDNLRNALLDRGRGQPDLVRAVLGRSEETALRVYECEVYDMEYGNGPGGWNTLSAKWGRALSGAPHVVFRAVHSWRDALARKEDESTRYVMPNHYLFQLAEKPPADKATLLAVFRPVPPLVRTQAASLLDIIHGAGKETFVTTGAGIEGENMKRRGHATDDAHLQIERPDRTTVNSENTSTRDGNIFPDLWMRQSGGLSATSSSLLGSKLTATMSGAELPSTRSMLFPRGWTSVVTSRVVGDASTQYQEVLSRIHSALVVAPIMPVIPVAAPESEDAKSSMSLTNVTTPAAEQEQIEIPFVPASQRQSHSLATKVETSDNVVVVGRTRERKRKRSKQQANVDGPDKGDNVKKARGEVVGIAEENEAIEARADEFDFASAPNFLDAPVKGQPVVLKPQTGKVSKGRRAFEYGNFPAPPRAYNEVKGANMSHTFKG